MSPNWLKIKENNQQQLITHCLFDQKFHLKHIFKLNTSSFGRSKKDNIRPKLSFTLFENDSDSTTGWKGPMGGFKVSLGIEVKTFRVL